MEITANRAGTNGGANEHATKTITVTVTDLDDEAPPISRSTMPSLSMVMFLLPMTKVQTF
ncbi:hypothetical protein BSPWISOXPB_9255 [uncultured Gammaproteobacteria bacterium]|nr:hypothetical protein BSPWISOXPB_9255 [uncultured Gammaproteobacteria bacterium]